MNPVRKCISDPTMDKFYLKSRSILNVVLFGGKLSKFHVIVALVFTELHTTGYLTVYQVGASLKKG